MKSSTNSSISPKEKLQHCLDTCPGPDICPYSGLLIVGFENPQPVICPRYKKWLKQVELEHELRNIVPENFSDKSFENFIIRSAETGKALQLMKKYVKAKAWRSGSSVLITGPNGVGKTHLSIATIREAMRLGETAALILPVDLMKGSFQEMNERFERLQAVGLFVLDDVANDFEKKYFMQRIFELFEHRYRRRKGMIFTTNLSVKEFLSAIGTRMFSRLYENLVTLEIHDVDDYRKTLRNKNLDWLKGEKT